MDDMRGQERLELHAERDFKSETGRNSVTTVGVDQSSTTGGNSTHKIAGAYSLGSGSTTISTGAYRLNATTIDESGRDHVRKNRSGDVWIALALCMLVLTGIGCRSDGPGGTATMKLKPMEQPCAQQSPGQLCRSA
jgi:hypothetical protein